MSTTRLGVRPIACVGALKGEQTWKIVKNAPDVLEGKTIVELGSGLGSMPDELFANSTNCNIYAVDLIYKNAGTFNREVDRTLRQAQGIVQGIIGVNGGMEPGEDMGTYSRRIDVINANKDSIRAQIGNIIQNPKGNTLRRTEAIPMALKGKVDVIYMSSMFYAAKHPQKFLEELSEYLTDEGAIIITEPYADYAKQVVDNHGATIGEETQGQIATLYEQSKIDSVEYKDAVAHNTGLLSFMKKKKELPPVPGLLFLGNHGNFVSVRISKSVINDLDLQAPKKVLFKKQRAA